MKKDQAKKIIENFIRKEVRKNLKENSPNIDSVKGETIKNITIGNQSIIQFKSGAWMGVDAGGAKLRITVN